MRLEIVIDSIIRHARIIGFISIDIFRFRYAGRYAVFTGVGVYKQGHGRRTSVWIPLEERPYEQKEETTS